MLLLGTYWRKILGFFLVQLLVTLFFIQYKMIRFKTHSHKMGLWHAAAVNCCSAENGKI